jgi:hypothetical protein
MKSTALVVVGVAGAVALALSVATGAWASGTAATPSMSKVYQTYLGSELLPYPSPDTILATPLPVGDYLVQVAIGIAPTDGTTDVSCNLQTTASTDIVIANPGGAQDANSPGPTAGATVGIDGTVVITQAHDQVEVVCSYTGEDPTFAGASLTAQPVGKIKLTQG